VRPNLLALPVQVKQVLAVAILDSSEIESGDGRVADLRRILPGLPIIFISATLR
jgi:hypothetical protein